MLSSTYTDKWARVPVAVRRFILRAFAILIAWKILYLVFLLPSRVLDKPLSHSVAASSAWVLNIYTHSAYYTTKSEIGNVATVNGLSPMPLENIYFHQKSIVSIEDGCNALELIILYAGFIICMPALLSRKIIFITGGIVLIHLTNIIRCAGITYIILYHPRYADFAHHYIFTFIVYGLIIALWLIFSKKLKLAHDQTEQ